MSKILIDNWNMEDILYEISYFPEEYFSDAFADLLNTIVLWDELYYPDNNMSQNWIDSEKNLVDVVKPMKDNLSFLHESEEIYNEFFEDTEYSLVAAGAIRYSFLSGHYGMGYLPCKDRSNFLNKIDASLYEKIFKSVTYNRKSSLRILDELIEERFISIKRFFPKLKVNFRYPVLIDYIRYNSSSRKSCIDAALQLKNEKKVVAYRRYMDQFESDLENETWGNIINFENEVQDIVNDIVKISEGKTFTVSGSISLMPSIDISTDFVLRKKYHLNFLRDLAEFSFSGKRKLR